MEIEKTFTPLEKSRMRLEVKVAQKDAAELYQNVLQKYAKTLQVPGFRKGKVPLNILESKYGPDLLSEARGDIVSQAIEAAIGGADQFHAPLPYADTVLDGEPAFDPKEDFSFAVEYDVFPKTDFAKIEGFEIEVPDVSVEEEDIQKELEAIRKRNALVVDKDDGDPAEAGDIVTLTYAEIDEDGNVIEGRQWHGEVIGLGEDSDDEPDMYGMKDIVPGMKKGETKETERAYPEGYKHQLLAGRTVRLKVTVDGLKRNELPDIDDELAQDVSEKYQTLDDLKNDIRKTFESLAENAVASMRKDALIGKIVEANDFELPLSMVAAELEGRWQTLARRFGVSSAQLEKTLAGMNGSKAEMYEKWRPEAEKELKARIAIESLIERLAIDVDPEDVEKELEKMAEDSGSSLDELKERYAEGRPREYLVYDIKERRLFEALLEKSTVKKGEKKSIDDLPSLG